MIDKQMDFRAARMYFSEDQEHQHFCDHPYKYCQEHYGKKGCNMYGPQWKPVVFDHSTLF